MIGAQGERLLREIALARSWRGDSSTGPCESIAQCGNYQRWYGEFKHEIKWLKTGKPITKQIISNTIS
ncbi:hypothetical protein AAV98_07000 [Bacillus sp. CHD6a]|nr:hypothetical protein AAV98_07000 [Bacillus sp. CHD6a]